MADPEYFEFQGRMDYQVKVKGYRVELGEIEQAAQVVEGVKEFIALVIGEVIFGFYSAEFGVGDSLEHDIESYFLVHAVIPLP
jgi:acyl-coenzyme A synthetase/AMP-(fatty) acid ligase